MKTYYLVISTPLGRAPLIGATMTSDREREVACKANARAFVRAAGREPFNSAEVSAWVREVLA